MSMRSTASRLRYSDQAWEEMTRPTAMVFKDAETKLLIRALEYFANNLRAAALAELRLDHGAMCTAHEEDAEAAELLVSRFQSVQQRSEAIKAVIAKATP